MPTHKLKLRPGVNVEFTPTLNEAGISASNLIRFFSGLPQKLGGWQQFPGGAFSGTCRGLFGWGDFAGNPYLAVGTNELLYVNSGGILNNITPVALTTNPAVNFSTIINTPTVTIIDAGATPAVGDWINLETQISVGGLVLFGFYQVQSVGGGNSYTITAASNATATVNNGGAVPSFTTLNTSATVTVTLANHGFTALSSQFSVLVSTTVATVVILGTYTVASVTNANVFTFTAGSTANASTTASENTGDARIDYLLAAGFPINTPVGGWGGGDWGAGDWGGVNGDTAVASLRYWSLDHWGEDLIASPRNLGIYSWSPPDTTVPAAVVPNAPIYNAVVFGMSQAQIIIAAGSEIGSTQFPTLVRWCDSGDREEWTASATNQAGSFQLPTGSAIVSGLAVGLGALIWTDVDLWSMTYQGLPFVFGFNRVGVNCEAISAKAPVVVGNSIVWPSDRGFYRYDGSGVAPLDCTVWDFMFNNIDDTQTDQVCSALNTLFNEVAWHFPIDPSSPIYDASTPIGFVKWNFEENLWDYGLSSQYQRTAWVDHSPVGNPIGADLTNVLQQHETGMDADDEGMVWYFRTGYFDVQEGGMYVRLDRVDPDFRQLTSGGVTSVLIQITIFGQDFPDVTPSVYGPYTVTSSTPYLNLNIRHRRLAIQIGGNDPGTFTRLGSITFRATPKGRR